MSAPKTLDELEANLGFSFHNGAYSTIAVMECVEALKDRVKALEAQRDELREALEFAAGFMREMETGNEAAHDECSRIVEMLEAALAKAAVKA